MHDPIFSRLFTSWRVEIPGGRWGGVNKKKKKALGLLQLHKLLPEASKCCKKHTQIFRFKFNQILGHLDLFKCQQPRSFPSYFRLPYISKCVLFHRNSKSNLGAPRAQKSNKNVPCLPHEPAHYTPALTRLSKVKRAPVIYGESKLKSHLFTDVMFGFRWCFTGMQWSKTWRRVLLSPILPGMPVPPKPPLLQHLQPLPDPLIHSAPSVFMGNLF